jgi:hypothetical protein
MCSCWKGSYVEEDCMVLCGSGLVWKGSCAEGLLRGRGGKGLV